MKGTKENMIGKYCVIDYSHKIPSKLLTDNPREAMWEANKSNTRGIINICGDREFYHDGERWRIQPI